MNFVYLIRVVYADGRVTLSRPYPTRQQAERWSRAWRRVDVVQETLILVRELPQRREPMPAA